MNKVKGSILVFMLLMITIISSCITLIVSIQNRDKNVYDSKNEITQCKYIAQGYRDLYLSYILNGEEHKLDSNIKIFNDLSYDLNMVTSEIDFDTGHYNRYKTPTTTLKVHCDYKGHIHNSIAYLTKYNQLLFTKDGVIEKNRYNNKDVDRFNILVEKISNYYKDSDINDLSNCILENYRGRTNIYDMVTMDYNGRLNSNEVKQSQKCIIGSQSTNTRVSFTGIFYNSGVIDLNADFRINGIFISDNGSINQNNYNFSVNGLFIEVGDINIKDNYPKVIINSRLDMYKYLLTNSRWTYNYELLYLFDVDDF